MPGGGDAGSGVTNPVGSVKHGEFVSGAGVSGRSVEPNRGFGEEGGDESPRERGGNDATARVVGGDEDAERIVGIATGVDEDAAGDDEGEAGEYGGKMAGERA